MREAAEFTGIRPTQNKLFLALGVVILAVVWIGYGARVFIPFLFHPDLKHILIRIHVVFVALWLCAFSGQVLFAALGRMRLHRIFGQWAFRIAALWVMTAFGALWALLHLDSNAGPDVFVLLTQISLFSLCMAMAYRERRNPPEHMRWVILGMSQAIITGIMRAAHLSYERSAGAALLFPFALLFYDAVIARRIYRASWAGGCTILAVHLVRVPISQSASWLSIAHWLASIGK